MAGSLSGWATEPKSLMTATPTMNQNGEMKLQKTVTRLWLCGLEAVIGTFQLVGSGATHGMGACSGRLWHL